MTRYEIYVLIVCIIVFTMLTALLTALIWYIVSLLLRSIKSGLEDEKIKIEYANRAKKQTSKALSFLDKAFSALVFLCLIIVFISALSVNIGKKTMVEAPRFQVVVSESMSKKHKKNTYLQENKLDNQFDMFDIILTHKLPAESELKKYDIIMYEVDDKLVIHRIVNIEEPNEKHPNERHFLLQGDNVDSPDKFPVLYSQMRAIYYGEKISFVGSIVLFLQSPAGYLCMILVVFAMIVSPIVDKILENAKRKRLAIILAVNTDRTLNLDEIPTGKKEEVPAPEPPGDPESTQVSEEGEETQSSNAEETPVALSAEGTSQAEGDEGSSRPEIDPEWMVFDPFVATLSPAERVEFMSTYVKGTVYGVPKYILGGDNRIFFRKFFINLWSLRGTVSDSLMEKIYQYAHRLRDGESK